MLPDWLFTCQTVSSVHRQPMRMLIALALACSPVAASAGTLALPPEQAEAAKEEGARRHAHDAVLGLEPVQDRAVHGEIGFAIGSGGYSAVFGTAVMPLGESGYLALSLADERGGGFGRRRFGPR